MPSTDSVKRPTLALATPVARSLSLRELAELLVKHYDLHEGLYDLLVELKVGVGSVPTGPAESDRLPGATVAIASLGLSEAQKPGPTTVDAAVINPALPAKTATTSKASGGQRSRKASA